MRLRGIVLLLLSGFLGTASAHETWILPATFSVETGQEVRFDLTSGLDFPALENQIQAERLSRAAYRLGKREVKLAKLEAKDTSLALSASFPGHGLARVWVELQPRDIELGDELVAQYLDEIGAGPQTRELWERQKGHRVWKESYTKYAKTFVVVGNAREDRSWAEAIGMGLEIVPVTDPLSLKVGRELTVKLVGRGKLLAGVPIGLRIEGSERVFKTTDAKGRATFPIARAGKAMLFAVHLRPAQDGTTWKSDFTNLTFLVP